MKLKDGEQMRAFDAIDLDGQAIDPGDPHYSMTLLSFYRYASCPFCNMRIAELRRAQEAFTELGIRPVAIFHSSADQIRQYVGRQAPWFPVVPDPNLKLYHLYEVTPSWSGLLSAFLKRLPTIMKAMLVKGYFPGAIDGPMNMLPADFLIDNEGLVVKAYYGTDIGDHLPISEIKSLAAEHQHAR